MALRTHRGLATTRLRRIGAPSLRFGGLHHSESVPWPAPLRLVSTTKWEPPPSAELIELP